VVQTLSINFEKPLPVFPLSTNVLLPHVALPLHIFEPRYLRMTSEALDSHGLIAMAVYAHEVDEHEYEHGRPELRPYVCLGYITQYQPLDDGRYLLLLQGVCRARVKEEVDHEPYRLARLEPIDIEPPADHLMDEERARLEVLLGDDRFESTDGIDQLRQVLDENAPTHAIVDLTVMTFCRSNPEHLYRTLSEPDAFARARWIIHHLEARRS